MDISGYCAIPYALFEYITFLTKALPLRSVPTFLELFIGAMITQAGFVTQAWLAIDMRRHWTSYYKWLQKGKWSWLKLAKQTLKLLLRFFPQSIWFFIIDDTIIFRASNKAPGSKIHHQHGSKANRPTFVQGQCWVSLAAVVRKGMLSAAIPVLGRMMRATGNTSKLDAAKLMATVVAPLITGQKVCFLLDSWYMRRKLLSHLLSFGFSVIGQVRIDTALYEIPFLTGKRGRPRKYGAKYTPEKVLTLTQTRGLFFIYGKWQSLRYRSAIASARFMRGLKVRVVWLQFEDKTGALTKQRLLLSTQWELEPAQIITFYARRWTIETMFNQIKNNWGWKEAWQQSRQVLHRWTQILSIAYALPQLLAIKGGDDVNALTRFEPWRDKHPITAGRVRTGLQRILGHVHVRHWWNPKSRKIEPHNRPKAPPKRDKIAKAA